MPASQPLDLISQLKHDHREIESIITSMGDAIDAQDTFAIQEKLQLLKTTIIAHKAQENWKLYTYLQRVTRTDPVMNSMMNNARKKGDEFLQDAKNFFETYLEQEFPIEKVATFSAEFKLIAEEIFKRMLYEEETLFPLYEKYIAKAA